MQITFPDGVSVKFGTGRNTLGTPSEQPGLSLDIPGVLLISLKFASSNQKHCPDLGGDASSVWNFSAHLLRRHFMGKPVEAL